MQEIVLRVQFAWLMVQRKMKEDWKFAMVEIGQQCVIGFLRTMMHTWPVLSLAFNQMV